MLTFDPHGHEYRWNGYVTPSVTTILDDLGFYPSQYYRNATARDAGTAIHRMCELWDHGRLVRERTHPDLLEYLDKAYLPWLEEYRPEFLGIEERLYSEAHDFAGTLDRRCRFKFGYAIVDLKRTTGDPPKQATELQTAAYEILAPPLDGGYRRFALVLEPASKRPFRMLEYVDPTARAGFLACREAWKWRKAA
jgi:hypothetical protein